VSCKEEPPFINLLPDATIADTTYMITNPPSPETKNVIIEEFTGVRCPNCPDAQIEAKRLAEANPGKINIVTIHPLNLLNTLTRPFDKNIGDKYTSAYDMRTEAGRVIFQLIGVTQQLPTGSVNRRLFSGETNFALDFSKWAAYVNDELTKTAPLKIETNANKINDSVEIACTVTYTQDVSDTNYLTIVITQDGIIDVQEKKVGGTTIYDEGYVHNHVLRAVVTIPTGDLLNPKVANGYELKRGRVFKKVYKFLLNNSWDVTKLHVVSIVHSNPNKKEVLQSVETSVK